MKRALITGITGFVGSHLAELLLKEGVEVFGTVRWRSKTDNIEHIKDKIKLVEADLRDSYSIQKAVDTSEPDYVFHLAAQSFVPTSWHAPQETIMTNIVGTLNLLEAVRKSKSDPIIQTAGSSEEYGLVYPHEIPIKESNPLRPLSPYGVSKVGQDKLTIQYHMSYGLKTMVTRAFNHTGPRRGEVFVCSDFSKQVAEIEKGKREPAMYVGNLSAKRDFTDVRDTVKAYWLGMNSGKLGEVYNISSGSSVSMQFVLDKIVSLSTHKGIEVKNDPKKMRPSDVEILEGDYSKFSQQTGWKPEIPFDTTLQDLLHYWRNRV
jgi:GDP-4-dehydro-6-deoxy-D-mannose reductase